MERVPGDSAKIGGLGHMAEYQYNRPMLSHVPKQDGTWHQEYDDIMYETPAIGDPQIDEVFKLFSLLLPDHQAMGNTRLFVLRWQGEYSVVLHFGHFEHGSKDTLVALATMMTWFETAFWAKHSEVCALNSFSEDLVLEFSDVDKGVAKCLVSGRLVDEYKEEVEKKLLEKQDKRA